MEEIKTEKNGVRKLNTNRNRENNEYECNTDRSRENNEYGSLERQVFEFIKRKKLVQEGGRVLAAVSGGADSVCLLLILKELEQALGICVEAVTVNHGIRGETAERDVGFVSDLCGKWKIPVHICRVEVPELAKREQLSEEEAARKARYRCFYETAEKIGASAVAVAHHRDDNCETILHHLFRGSSLRGLRGMEASRKMGSLNVIRPFLETGRREIEEWLEERRISWCTDETNLEDDYTRNRLRHHVIPLVEAQINQQASAHVAQAGAYIAEAQELLEELAAKWLQSHGKWENTGFCISIPALCEVKPIVRREILIQALKSAVADAVFKDVGHVHLEMIWELAQGETSRRIALPSGISVRKQYEWLVFTKEDRVTKKEQTEKTASFISLPDGNQIEIQVPELANGILFRIFSYNGEKIPENNYTKWLDYDRIKNGLSLRTRRTGDYFLLDGGGRKTVKSYMIDQKIPAEQRASMPLLAAGSHVLWLSDGRISAGCKVSDETRYILELYLKEEKISHE
ncbi:MAG: tRNA lysidine(34) synthetase TilS [Lachnospiraceae bacterium]|nr:tRNA lysidine(34) synthetase TilS [Lachnospiraceae bacterium]